jgi:hypothetical protein
MGKNEKQEPVKNEEIAFTCGACRKTFKKGEQIITIFPLVATTKVPQPQPVMVCKYCGVLSFLPTGSVQPPQIEQPKIILPN